jgi:ABC-type thiamine transport system substrate-binding protein
VRGAFGGPEGAASKKLARELVEFLLSGEAQSVLPATNWMLPVVPGTKLPASYAGLPKPLKLVRTTTDARAIARELAEWKRAISGAGGAK